MSFGMPKYQTVVCEGEDGLLRVNHDATLPGLGPEDVLVRTKAVAINPCDYKMHERFPCAGAIDGCDFSGIVVAVGTAVSESGSFRVGDRVCGAVHGSNPARPEVGSFAEWLVSESEFTLKIPPDMSFEQAAAIGGTGVATLSMALFHDSSLGLPGTPEEPAPKPRTVLVHGGSSSVGTMAIQLVRLVGHIPITTCSPRNFALVNSYGAERAFNYSDPNCAKDIKSYTRNSLSYVLDPFTDSKSIALCCGALGRAGGRYACLEMYPDYLLENKLIKVGFTMGPALLGHRLELDHGYEREANPAMRAFGVRWYKSLQKLLDQGKLRPHPIRVLGDLPWYEAVLKGIEMVKSKSISGQKLVVVIDRS
ncbi:putative zinc-binding dehydrogenase family oxidoreductase [Daldinia bambusicola]|nr:putative zinc-binding dehydrogenase family oxidoreductase [Daldinia bambusicola]